jgi:hypothetical protein
MGISVIPVITTFLSEITKIKGFGYPNLSHPSDYGLRKIPFLKVSFQTYYIAGTWITETAGEIFHKYFVKMVGDWKIGWMRLAQFKILAF